MCSDHPFDRRQFLSLLLCSVLAACGGNGVGEERPDSPPQHWKGLDIRVETRPSPPHEGMAEFLVIVTTDNGRPGWDCIIDVRTSDQDEWKQCIQDGRVGVYRRAALVNGADRSTVQVQVKRREDTTVLYFPLKVSAG